MMTRPQLRSATAVLILVLLAGAWRVAAMLPDPVEEPLEPTGVTVPLEHLQPPPPLQEAQAGTKSGGDEAADPTDEPAAAGPPRARPQPAGEDGVLVHVAGHVHEPGLYAVPEGARVADAVAAAGDVLDPRVLDHLNLARRLYDEDRIYVPSWDEVQDLLAAGVGGWEPYGEGGGSGPVNLNRAEAEALQRLPGVGPSLAERIVESRRLDGPFASLEEVTRVPGIGPRTVAQWEGLAVVR